MPVSSSKASAVVNKTKSLEELYDMLNTDFDLGSLDEFKTKLESPDKRKILYEAANTNNVLGKSFDEFELNFGFKKKDQSETKLEPDVQPKAPADLSLPASSAQPQGPSQLESASRLSSEDKQPYNFGATPDEVKNNAKLYHDKFISKAKKKIDDAEAQFNQQVEWLNGEVSTGKIGRAEANGLIRGFKSQYLRLSSRAQEEYESELQDLQDQANNVITSFGAPATNVVKKPEPIVDGPKESSTVARAALAFAYRNDPDVRSAVDRAMDVIRVESPSGAYFSTSLPDIYSVFDYNKANDIITKFKQAEKEPLVGDQVGRIKYSTNPLNYNTLAGAALAYFSFEDNDVYQALQKASKDSKKVFEGGSEVDTRTLPGNIRDVFGSKKTDEYIARFLALPNIQTYIRTNPYLYNEIQAKNRRDVLDQLQLQTVEDYFAKSGITPQGLRYQKIDMNTPVAKDLFMNPQKYGITIDQEDPIGSLENVYDEAFGQEILQLNTPKVDATANNAIRYSPQKMSADIQRQREIDLDTKRRTFIADQYKMLLEDKQSANKFLSSFLKNPDLNTGRMTSVQLEGLRDDVSKNRTALFALETLIKSKKVEEDLVGAKSIEEAAVLFSAMTDRDLAKVVSDNTTLVNARLFPAKTPFYEKAAPQVKSIGDINQYLGPATIGMSMYSLLSDPVAMQQLKQSNPSIYNELVNRKDELFDRYRHLG
jgi:hypothetical protein